MSFINNYILRKLLRHTRHVVAWHRKYAGGATTPEELSPGLNPGHVDFHGDGLAHGRPVQSSVLCSTQALNGESITSELT